MSISKILTMIIQINLKKEQIQQELDCDRNETALKK